MRDNPVIISLLERKSVRIFEEKEITQETKDLILECATAAPSAGNQQLYTIIDVTSQELKDKLAVSCDNQPFIGKASMVLIFCADAKKWYDVFCFNNCSPRVPNVGDLLLAVSDANIAAQNAVTAAEALGIGSCYIGDIMEQYETHRELLGLPQYVFPTAMLVFGYPTQQQKERNKPIRCERKYIVHENGYQTMTGEQLNEMLAHRAGNGEFTQWIEAFCNRKYNSEFSSEMSRAVREYINDFGK